MYKVLTMEMPANMATGYVFRGFLISPRTWKRTLARTPDPTGSFQEVDSRSLADRTPKTQTLHGVSEHIHPTEPNALTNRQKRMRITIRLV